MNIKVGPQIPCNLCLSAHVKKVQLIVIPTVRQIKQLQRIRQTMNHFMIQYLDHKNIKSPVLPNDLYPKGRLL